MNSETPILDKEILDHLRAALGDRVSHILEVYLAEVPRTIGDMRTALAKQDFEAIRIMVHSLKSSSANVGAMRISVLAADMERKLQHKETNRTSNEIEELQEEFDQVRPLFNDYL